jgi:predicted AAA+ superfamily ATPase
VSDMMKNIIERKQYLSQLIKWKDHQMVKVITGIRRSGKSTLLCSLYRDYLINNGISGDQIIMVNLESIENEHLYHYKSLYEHIVNLLRKDKMNYVIIDEIQNAFEFQRAVDSLFIKDNVDLYITGSNAYMLSGELATLLSGRYITIEILPLSFSEFVDSYNSEKTIEAMYREYLRYGGFPYITQLLNDEKQTMQYLEGIYNTILKKDVISRNKVADIFVLEDVIRFVFDNIGNIVSSKKISDTLTSNGRKVSRPTVDTYLNYLINGYAVYKVNRFDIKGKEYLKSLEKYYVTDIGLRNYLLGFRNIDRGHVLENIVYLELRRRGYEIYIGKYDNKEIDFLVKDSDEVFYIQVAESIKSKVTLERELVPLRAIKDFNRRAIITMDYDMNESYDGIKVINVIEWLLKKVDILL